MRTHRRKYASLRRRLRDARLSVGLTQFEAGRRMGWPQSYISKIELGRRQVDAVELRHLARIYRTPLERLLR